MHVGNARQAQLVRGRAHGAIAQHHAAAMQALPVAGQLEGQLGGLCGEVTASCRPTRSPRTLAGRRACCCHCIRPSASSALSSGSEPGGTRTSSPLMRTSSAQLSFAELQRGRSARAQAEADRPGARPDRPVRWRPRAQSGPRRAGARELERERAVPGLGRASALHLIEPRSSRRRRAGRASTCRRARPARAAPCGSRAAVVLNVASSCGPAVASVIRPLPCSWKPSSGGSPRRWPAARVRSATARAAAGRRWPIPGRAIPVGPRVRQRAIQPAMPPGEREFAPRRRCRARPGQGQGLGAQLRDRTR